MSLRLETVSPDSPGVLTPGLIRNINTDLAEAQRQVESREMERVTVNVAITVGRNKEDELVMVYARRGTTLEKGRLQVAPTGQGRLLEEG